ncbi:hypothetical protein FMM05_06185 [Flavobacterium zepuense]|uniref:Uncharacterized protein n=1 Tax=Flavobacterium zepuense TaxID=2593302 RepID=A0A552V5R9_9FLAO|nr:hypothetical protein [Flavobacterium zepuense]TRW25809.1 hypothetical protein FMM05_06185 [Flavobacterium zepuense]
MRESDNKFDHTSEEHGSNEKKSPIPQDHTGINYNEKAHMSGNIQKNTIAHERSQLNANQEQRPDSRNPERNRDK